MPNLLLIFLVFSMNVLISGGFAFSYVGVINRNIQRLNSARINSELIEVNKTRGILRKLDNNKEYVLTYYGLMLSGAIARRYPLDVPLHLLFLPLMVDSYIIYVSVAVTAVHPLNVVKTMLQKKGIFILAISPI